MTLKELEPKAIWHYFSEICTIPRPSKKEEKVIAYLQDFGKKNGLETVVDTAGNVLIRKPATSGYETHPTVILQAHMDMVCEKNSDTIHDFDVLSADDLQHGPLECLFTVDEETGLTGAFALDKNLLSGSLLINLDSEDDGEFFIGCAGGIDTTVVFDYQPQPAPDGLFYFKVGVKGLTGGHSGDDIEKGLGNANKILTRFLWQIAQETKLTLASFDGGNLRNAIAREAFAVAAVPSNYKETLRVQLNLFIADVEAELAIAEKNFTMVLESTVKPAVVIDDSTAKRLLYALYACPHGVLRMSDDMPGLVETSTNLASVKMGDNNRILIATSQRSSIESAKNDVARMVESVFVLAGATATHGDGYPGWKPNPNSKLAQLTAETYEKLFGEKAKIRAIHAGLECGLFLKKYPHLDMVSIGPTMRGVHSPDERLHIAHTEKFWKLLVEILASL